MISLNLINHFFNPRNIIKEEQNEEYEGVIFEKDNLKYRSRLAKKTTKKNGYFVVFWEKDEFKKNKAYSFENAPDFTLVWIADQNRKGLFKFPKKILLDKKILRNDNQKGKMGIRVYTNWDTDLNTTAKKTQDWQKDYFTELSQL
ncbi:MepB family protein [Vagococcus vulneris]|uniref:MepB protein n=1 Tax=Vagococcus vulneris TaxID=1977869 RepID=A0A430A2M5_9ENTE|nr:MepB family protein [Vagococcus vulneris]RSU00698.1 hypothetical protein CBF37_01420 [Vagococcus vulneris]